MEIKTTSILVDDNGEEVKVGECFSLLVGKRSLIGKYVGVKSQSMVAFENPITNERFNIRLSSISKFQRCTFKIV